MIFKKRNGWVVSDWFTMAQKQDLVTRGMTNG